MTAAVAVTVVPGPLALALAPAHLVLAPVLAQDPVAPTTPSQPTAFHRKRFAAKLVFLLLQLVALSQAVPTPLIACPPKLACRFRTARTTSAALLPAQPARQRH